MEVDPKSVLLAVKEDARHKTLSDHNNQKQSGDRRDDGASVAIAMTGQSSPRSPHYSSEHCQNSTSAGGEAGTDTAATVVLATIAIGPKVSVVKPGNKASFGSQQEENQTIMDHSISDESALESSSSEDSYDFSSSCSYSNCDSLESSIPSLSTSISDDDDSDNDSDDDDHGCHGGESDDGFDGAQGDRGSASPLAQHNPPSTQTPLLYLYFNDIIEEFRTAGSGNLDDIHVVDDNARMLTDEDLRTVVAFFARSAHHKNTGAMSTALNRRQMFSSMKKKSSNRKLNTDFSQRQWDSQKSVIGFADDSKNRWGLSTASRSFNLKSSAANSSSINIDRNRPPRPQFVPPLSASSASEATLMMMSVVPPSAPCRRESADMLLCEVPSERTKDANLSPTNDTGPVVPSRRESMDSTRPPSTRKAQTISDFLAPPNRRRNADTSPQDDPCPLPPSMPVRQVSMEILDDFFQDDAITEDHVRQRARSLGARVRSPMKGRKFIRTNASHDASVTNVKNSNNVHRLKTYPISTSSLLDDDDDSEEDIISFRHRNLQINQPKDNSLVAPSRRGSVNSVLVPMMDEISFHDEQIKTKPLSVVPLQEPDLPIIPQRGQDIDDVQDLGDSSSVSLRSFGAQQTDDTDFVGANDIYGYHIMSMPIKGTDNEDSVHRIAKRRGGFLMKQRAERRSSMRQQSDVMSRDEAATLKRAHADPIDFSDMESGTSNHSNISEDCSLDPQPWTGSGSKGAHSAGDSHTQRFRDEFETLLRPEMSLDTPSEDEEDLNESARSQLSIIENALEEIDRDVTSPRRNAIALPPDQQCDSSVSSEGPRAQSEDRSSPGCAANADFAGVSPSPKSCEALPDTSISLKSVNLNLKSRRGRGSSLTKQQSASALQQGPVGRISCMSPVKPIRRASFNGQKRPTSRPSRSSGSYFDGNGDSNSHHRPSTVVVEVSEAAGNDARVSALTMSDAVSMALMELEGILDEDDYKDEEELIGGDGHTDLRPPPPRRSTTFPSRLSPLPPGPAPGVVRQTEADRRDKRASTCSLGVEDLIEFRVGNGTQMSSSDNYNNNISSMNMSDLSLDSFLSTKERIAKRFSHNDSIPLTHSRPKRRRPSKIIPRLSGRRTSEASTSSRTPKTGAGGSGNGLRRSFSGKKAISAISRAIRDVETRTIHSINRTFKRSRSSSVPAAAAAEVHNCGGNV